MTDRIELTPDELRAVAKVAWKWPDHPQDQQSHIDTVTDVVAAINRVREGDPVGTVRRSPPGWVENQGRTDGRASAVMTEKGWRLSHEGGDCRSWLPSVEQPNSFVLDWPIVFQPAAVS